MAKKTAKKKNRKMRRQIRKTVGALFMASAIAVAAIPVTDVSADEAPATADNYQSFYQSLKVHETGEDDESGSNIYKIYIERYETGSDSSHTKHEQAKDVTVNEKLVTYDSTVPVVAENSTVFVDYQTEGDFRVTFYFAISGKSAVILGAEIGSLPTDSDGNRYLTIPDKVIACQLYAVGGKYCAVNVNDEFLYYQKEEDTFIVYGLEDKEAGTNYTLVKRSEIKTESDGATEGIYYYQGVTEDTGEVTIFELPAELYIRARYYPCYREDYAAWADETLYVYDENYSYTASGASGTSLFSGRDSGEGAEATATPTASASPSAGPSESPSAAPVVTPSGSPSASPTGLSEETPTPTPTELPEETPTPTPTELPEETPAPTPTELPEGTPTPTPTELQEETPTPTPTELPEETPTPTPMESPMGTASESLSEEETSGDESASISMLASETYSYTVDDAIMAENNVPIEQKKLSLNDNLIRKYVSSDFNVNDENEIVHLRAVGDSGTYMSLEVNYIGQQYLADDSATGEKIIAGLVTSANAKKGVFAQNSNINILYTGNYLLGIGDYAFYGCTGLSSIQANQGVNDGLTTIGNGAFAYCMFLKKCDLSLAQNLQVIGMDTFLYCWQMESLNLPASVQAYGDYCFMGCLGLSDFSFNTNLAYIGYNAFVDCTALPWIEFPKNYREQLPIRYFANCTSLQYIKVQNETCDLIDVWKDGIASDEDDAHKADPCDINAFLSALTYDGFYIEGSYNDVSYAIYKTAKEHSVPFSYKDSEGLTHYEKTEICTEFSEDGTETHPHEIIYDIVVEDGIDKLSGIKFDDDCEMHDLVLPSNIGGHYITAIEEESFQGNCNLESITIPASVSLIKENAFRGCHNLNCVIFEHSENDPLIIEENAFNTQDITYGHDCGNDSALALEPELSFVGVISPDFAAFNYAMGSTFNNSKQADSYIAYYSGWPTNLKVVYNPDNPEGQRNELVDYPSYSEIYKGYKLGDYPYLTQEMITAAQEAIDCKDDKTKDNSVYQSIRNAGLNVNLPAGITAIAPGLFSGLNANGKKTEEDAKADVDLESITLNTVKEVEPYAFAGCTGLTRFYYAGDGSGSGYSIGDYAFRNCGNLTDAEIGSSISEIGIRPFAGCGNLTAVNFSGSNFTTDNSIIYALANGAKTGVVECLECRSKQITASELVGITTLWEEAFKNCDKVVSVDLSQSSVAAIPSQAFAQMDKLGIVTLSSSTATIGTGAFWNTTSLYSVEIPNDRISIAADAFADVAAYTYDSEGNITDTLDVEDGEIDLSSGSASVLSKGSEGARIDDEIGFICSTGSTASNYAENYYYIETEEVVQVRYYVTPQGVDNAKSVLISTVSVPVDIIADADTWKEYRANYEPDLSNSKLWPDYQYAGYTFEGWDEYEYSEDGYYFTYAVFSKTEGVTFLAKDPTDSSAPWETVTTVALDDNFEEPNLNDSKWSDWHFDGYTFVNWTYSADGTIAYANFSTESVTVYFVDIKNTSQGMVSIQITPGSRVDEDDIPEPADPDHFTGWEADDSVDISIKDKIYENVTFYARYSDVTSQTPTPTPTIDPDATATPTSSPSATATPTSSSSATATPTSNPSATATPTSSPSATATPTPEIIYVNAEKTKYTVSVSGGSGSGSYAAGDIVAINAYYRGDGQTFDKWTTSTAGVGFANDSSSSTTFIMPAANVAITATYKTGSSTSAAGESTGSGNGSSGNSGTSAATNSGTSVEITKPGFSNTGLAGATVSGATDNFIVKVTDDQSATDAVVAALQARYGDISRIKYLPMDISLYDSTGRTKIADTTGISINITIPIPDDLVQYAGNNKAAAVVNGALEDLNVKFTTVDGVPCINFTAAHFSPYVIYVDTANLTAGTIDATPKTGDPIHPKWFLAIGMACISLILFFKKDKTGIKTKLA